MIRLVALIFGCIAIAPVYQAASLANTDVCTSPGVVARKLFVLGQFLFLTDQAQHFETYRILNISSGAITSRHHASDFSSQTQQGLQWAFMFDASYGRCGSEQLHSPYCARVHSLRGLIVARNARRQLIFLRLRGSGTGAALSVDSSGNFIEIQVLLRHLDAKFGYVSSLTFEQVTDQFVSTHYGRLGQVCVTRIRHRGQPVPLPFPEEILNENIFLTVCLPSARPYNSVIDLHGQLYGITSVGSVDRLQLVGTRFQVSQTLTDKAFLNCSNLVRSRHRDDDSDKKESQGYGIFALIFVAITVGALFVFGFLCYIGTINTACCCTCLRGSVKGAIGGAKDALKENASKSSPDSTDAKGGRSIDKVEGRSRSKRSSRRSRSKSRSRKASRSASKRSKRYSKKDKSGDLQMEKGLAMANRGFTKTIKSLRVLGRQLGNRLMQWNASGKAPLKKFSGESDASSNWALSSVSVTPLTDDTENGGVDLATSTTVLSRSRTSESTEQMSSTGEYSKDSAGGLLGNEGHFSEEEKSHSLVQVGQSTDLLTTATISSLLSSEKELPTSSVSSSRRSASLLMRPAFGPKQYKQNLPSAEEMTLSQAISCLLEQYHKLKPGSTQADGKSRSPSPSSSPSLPTLLKPGQVSQMTGHIVSLDDEKDSVEIDLTPQKAVSQV